MLGWRAWRLLRHCCVPPYSAQSPLRRRLVERMADGDADVRKALVRLLREQCIPNVESGALRPFMPMIMAHVCRWGLPWQGWNAWRARFAGRVAVCGACCGRWLVSRCLGGAPHHG